MQLPYSEDVGKRLTMMLAHFWTLAAAGFYVFPSREKLLQIEHSTAPVCTIQHCGGVACRLAIRGRFLLIEYDRFLLLMDGQELPELLQNDIVEECFNYLKISVSLAVLGHSATPQQLSLQYGQAVQVLGGNITKGHLSSPLP